MLKKLLNYSITLYIFLLPWQARFLFAEYSLETPYYGGLSMYVTDILFIILFTAWFVWVLKNWALFIQRLKKSSSKQKVICSLSIIFFFYAFVSVFWFPFDEMIAFVKWVRLLQAGLFMLMVATIPIRVRALFLALLASGLIQSLWGMQQFFLQEISSNTYLGVASQIPSDLGVSVIEYSDQRWLRAYGGFSHPNIFGAFLSICTLIASSWIFSVYKQIGSLKGRWQTITAKEIQPIRIQVIASLILFCFLMIGLLFTFSRTAWLGFAAGWGFLYFSVIYTAKNKYDKKIMIISGIKQIIAGALILFALSYLVGPLWSQRANDSSRLGQQSFTERAELIDQAKHIIDQQPVLGSGIGSYIVKIRESNPGKEVFSYQPVHNVWLLLWAELGWIGLIPFFGMIAFFLYAGKSIIKREFVSIDALTIFSILGAISIMVYFEHFWWTLLFGNLFLAIWFGLFIKIQLSKNS